MSLYDPEVSVPPLAVSTFSIVAVDTNSGDLGVAVASKFLAVGAVVPVAEASVGAVATQAWANTTYGPRGLAMLRAGASAHDVVRILTATDTNAASRQLGLVDSAGQAAAYSGAACHDYAGHKVGEGFTVQGNLLTGPEVIDALAETFATARRQVPSRPGVPHELADWLMAAMSAGQAAGGDRRGQQSAALLVVRAGGGYSGLSDRYLDLRVDDHPQPVMELARLLALHRSVFGLRPPR